MEINSTDYHDFVIKGGRLIAEFEQMYQKSAEVPWHQDQQESWVDVRLTLELLRSHPDIRQVTDYGCGLGHYLDILVRGLQVSHGLGFDISETALRKARANFPKYAFHRADLTETGASMFDGGRTVADGPELHVIRGTLWYVFPSLATVVNNLVSRVKKSDLLLVVQNFPPLGSNFVGKEVIPNPQALIKHFAVGPLRLQDSIWYEKQTNNSNDSWFIGVFKR